jgi:hypothetical protein
MKAPESYAAKMLGDLDNVEVNGQAVRISKLLRIPHGDLEGTLYKHVEKVTAWKRILAHCHEALDDANEALEEIKRVRFVHYWQVLEEKERDEMARTLHEADPSTDPFKRKRWVKDRIANGVPERIGRWRRNFTDDLVWGYVHNDDDVILRRRARRDAKRQLEIAQGIVDALEHRMRCISHLCARDRTPSA